jgi:hypothetical protein
MSTIPSLALIPSGVKASKVYSVLPTNGTGDFDFTRSGNATKLNSEGLIELVSTNVPRLNYPLIDGVVSGCPSLLLEPQRINSFSYSEPIANSGSASGISYESFIWSLGFTNCVKFGDNSALRFRYGGSVLASTQYTVSAFVIMDDLSEPLVGNSSSVGDFSFVAGGIVGGVVNSNVYYGNNIYRVSTTLTSGSNLSNNGVIKYTTQSSKGFRITGFQAEVGSYPTSYIPTTTSATTRSAETCNNAGDVNTFNDSEGVLFVEISALANDGTTRRLSISDGTTSNRIVFSYSNVTNQFQSFLANPSVPPVQFNFLTTLSNSVEFNKIAVKYKQNDFALWINGVKVATDTNGTVANGLNTLNFDEGSGASDFYGNTKQIQYFPTALNDSDLETLTSWDSFSDMATSQLYTIE